MLRGMADAKKRINGTQKMESTLKNYLSTLKPAGECHGGLAAVLRTKPVLAVKAWKEAYLS
eukprot:9240059-Alexandrium_andersonii.AAC.1